MTEVYWLVACCLTGREEAVKTWWIERYPERREELYYPLAHRTIRRGKSADRETVTRAAMPGYVFVKDSPVAETLDNEPDGTSSGVYCFIHVGDKAAALPDKDIRKLMEREKAGEFDIGPVNPLAFKIGMEVQLLGRRGVVTRIKDSEDRPRLQLTGGNLKAGAIWVDADVVSAVS